MTENQRQFDDTPMDLFFDNLMPEDQGSAYLAKVESSDAFLASQKLQSKIDRSLKHIFGFERAFAIPLAADVGDSLIAESEFERRNFSASSRFVTIVRIAIAASLLAVAMFTVWQLGPWGQPRPFFKPVPLAQIYQETVQRGFKPYYECHDRQRFGDTFEHRQGVRLGLRPMSPDHRMLGLSYLGGISRSTTAMLCEVGQSKVLVFVDSEENDQMGPVLFDNDSGLNIFRKTRFGLVFYEVSPLPHPTMMDYFDFPD